MLRNLIINIVVLFGISAGYGQTTAFVGVNVVPMDRERVIVNQTVIVRNGVIAEIGDAARVLVPKGANRIEGAGKYIIPGLFDMHVHLAYTGKDSLKLFIQQGITGVRDMGGEIETIRSWLRLPGATAPRVFAAGAILEADSFIKRLVRIDEILRKEDIEPMPAEIARLIKPIGVANAADAKIAINYLKQQRVDFAKIRSVESREAYFAIAREAKRAGLMFVGHSPSPLVSLEEASNAGQKSIEHLYFYESTMAQLSVSDRQRIYRVFKRNRTCFVPTIATEKFRNSADRDVDSILKGLFNRTLPESVFLTKSLQASFERDWKIRLLEHKIEKIDPAHSALDEYQKNIGYLREIRDAGVNILAGTDVGAVGMLPGYSLHRELEFLVRDVGMSPFEALCSATIQPARFLGMSDSLGTIEIGKKADMVLLDANPLEGIENSSKITGVVYSGRYYPRSEPYL